MSKCDFNGEAFHYRLDNIFISFNSKLYRHIVGINMGTYCVPLLANLFCFCFVMRETFCCLFLTSIRLNSQEKSEKMLSEEGTGRKKML